MRASGADALIAESKESGMTRFKAQIAGRSLRVSDRFNFIKREDQILQDYNPGSQDPLNQSRQTNCFFFFNRTKMLEGYIITEKPGSLRSWSFPPTVWLTNQPMASDLFRGNSTDSH